LGKTIALRFEIVRFLKKPALYALKTLNFKLTLPSLGHNHTARIPSPLPLHVAKTGRNNLNEKFTPLLPTGIGERF
jgi:hypothetical protein